MTTPVKDYSSNLSLIGSPHPSTSTNEYHSCVYLGTITIYSLVQSLIHLLLLN